MHACTVCMQATSVVLFYIRVIRFGKEKRKDWRLKIGVEIFVGVAFFGLSD